MTKLNLSNPNITFQIPSPIAHSQNRRFISKRKRNCSRSPLSLLSLNLSSQKSLIIPKSTRKGLANFVLKSTVGGAVVRRNVRSDSGISSPSLSRNRSDCLGDKIGLCYILKNRMSSSREIEREGNDVTITAFSKMMRYALKFLSMRLGAVNPRIDFNIDSLLVADNGSMMDGNVQNMVAPLMWPEVQMNGNRQHYQQQWPMDALHPPAWAREEDGYNFITPENSLLSYDSANSGTDI